MKKPMKYDALKIGLIWGVFFITSCAQNKPVLPNENSDNQQAEEIKQQQDIKQSQAVVIQKSIKVSELDKKQYQLGMQALSDLDLDRAQVLFQGFIRNNPNNSEGYASFALVYFKRAEYKKALTYINKALALNTKQAQSYNLRAQLHIKNGQIHQAKKDYLMAIKLKPNYVNAHYNIALLYDIYFQEIELAIEHYRFYLSQLTTPDKVTEDWIKHLLGTLNNG